MLRLIEAVKALGLPHDLAMRIVLADDPERALEDAKLCIYAKRLDLVGTSNPGRRILDDRAAADVHIDTAPRVQRNVFEARNAA